MPEKSVYGKRTVMKKREMVALVGLFLMVEGAVQILYGALAITELWPASSGGILRIIIGAVLWFRSTENG